MIVYVNLPVILLSKYDSSSVSFDMASQVGLGAPGKVTSTMLMLSLLPYSTKIKC